MTKQVAKKEDITLPIVQPSFGPENANDIFFNSDLFAQAQRAAELLSKSTMIPEQYRNKMSDCFIALASANRLNVDVFAYMQSSYVVHGRPGIEAKLVIALVNTRGPFDGPIQWRMEGGGNDRQCTAYARHSKTKELCEFTLTWAMVVAEGWNKKKGTMESKWITLPDLMFRYRSATFLARLYCPEVIQGITTVEELSDIQMAVTSDGTYEVEKEIAEKANQTPIDIDTETGEVVDIDEIPPEQPQPPPETIEPEKDTQALIEDKEMPEPQENEKSEESEPFGAEPSEIEKQDMKIQEFRDFLEGMKASGNLEEAGKNMKNYISKFPLRVQKAVRSIYKELKAGEEKTKTSNQGQQPDF